MLVLTKASLATVEELFEYKKQGFKLDEFPGYTPDQWGIKAHNRPWIANNGEFRKGQKVIEVGGAYSLLPKYLAEKYKLEAWNGDDFGMKSDEEVWARWGDPKKLLKKYPMIRYVFERFGEFSEAYPDEYFDRIFTVSTLEHIPQEYLLDVFKDMHRCLKKGGKELHTVDIPTTLNRKSLMYPLTDKFSILRRLVEGYQSKIMDWVELVRASGVKIEAKIPNSLQLFDRRTLVESPDVVYRFYPPNDAPKQYYPAASLLLVIEDV